MPEAPDFLERLKQYDAILDSRISELARVMEAGVYSEGIQGVSQRLTDSLTISTYRVAVSDLRHLFPELKRK